MEKGLLWIFVTAIVARHVNSRCDLSVLRDLMAQNNCDVEIVTSLYETRGLAVDSVNLHLNELFMGLNNRPSCTEIKSIIASCIAQKYYWSLEYVEQGDFSLKVYLHDITNVSSNVDEISDLLASRNQIPVLSTIVGERLEVERAEYNTTCHCWDVRIDETIFEYLAYVVIEPDNEFNLFGSSMAKSLVSLATKNFQSIGDIILKPSKDFKSKLFSSICSPHHSILATETLMIFTNDAFETSHVMKIAEKLSSDLTVEEHIVSTLMLTFNRIFIVVRGKIYSSFLRNQKFEFTRVHLKNGSVHDDDINIIGISSPPICYRGSVILPENLLIFAWSLNAIFLISASNDDEILVMRQMDLQNMTDLNYAEIHQSINPELILVRVESSVSKQLYFQCRKTECESLNIQFDGIMKHEIVLNSANNALLIWDSRSITQAGLDGKSTVTFTSDIEDIYFNTDKNAWLVRTEDDKLYYGRLHLPSVVEMRVFSNGRNSVYLFLSYADVRLITWSKTGVDSVKVNSKVYPILSEIQHAVHNVGNINQIHFNPYSSLRNAMRLESVQDSFKLSLDVLTTRYDGYKFEIYHDFQNLSLIYQVTEDVSSKYMSANYLLHAREITIELIADCKVSPQKCQTGFGLIELVYLPVSNTSSKSALLNSHSQVYLINMACPVGLNLRIAKSGEHVNCTSETGRCQLVIDEGELVYLEFEVYKNEEYLSEIVDDLLLIEINNRTGFELHNLNLLRKVCYHCSHFREVNSSSHLMLQTMRSACPCKIDAENENKWIGNISFAHAIANPNGENVFVFSAQVLSSSFCDLRTEFSIELIQMPSLNFLPWEYIFMLVFVAITVISLCISYHNYIKHMKMNRERLKISKSH